MKKFILTCVGAVAVAAALTSALPSDGILSTDNGVTVVNTTELAKDVRGYKGATPLKIYIQNNKIVKVEALKNMETPKYFALVKRGLLDKWDGKSVAKAAKMKVDGVTGATFSSEAVKQNVKRGLAYYKEHKK
ncbi:MAG: FMN-binding protein [Prevotella sp.]|nr:FMN-binding protein [Prevotella sp.]